MPLLLMVLVIPLPFMAISALTSGMQLISSQLGTDLLRLMGIPVFLEGNIIDLGTYKLQVVEACSGLRYLFSLISIALILVYFLKANNLIKVVILTSTIPITIFMNSFRIAVTGLLVKNYGNSAAEGFLHDFEGWVVFMAAFIMLLLVVRILTFRISDKISFNDLFNFEKNTPCSRDLEGPSSHSVGQLGKITLLLIPFAITTNFFSIFNQAYIADRKDFVTFPMRINHKNVALTWLDQEIIDILKADDYFLGTYGSSANDGHGHGTHVMSTVLGKTVGVATKAKGVGVKVLSDSGSGSAGEPDPWAGSRVISAQKANTAVAFSTDGLALSTANLFTAVQPGGSLYGLQHSNPVDVRVAYLGDPKDYGTSSDPMAGLKIGGVNIFGGGLALYNGDGILVGAVGVSGDYSCADHNIAWATREALTGLTVLNVPGGVGPATLNPVKASSDNIDYTVDGGWSHAVCGATMSDISDTF